MIPLVAPTITHNDRRAMARAAKYGALFDEGTVREYEAAFAERVECAGAVAVCSGTTALILAFDMWGNDKASIPTYTCSASWNAASASCPLTPTFVDGEYDVQTATMWQEDATLIVHSFGTPNERGVGAIEDYTLSLGGVDMLVANIGVCSTHATKMISTGRGGIVFSNDTDLLDEVRAQAYYDTTPNGTLGAHSLGMSSTQAALGLSQLAQLDTFIARRREIAAAYTQRFRPLGIDCPDDDSGSVFFRYLVAVESPADKVAALAEHGIEAGRGVYPTLHQQLGLPDEDFPGAMWCVNHLLSIPCHPSLTDDQVAFIAEKVAEVCAP